MIQRPERLTAGRRRREVIAGDITHFIGLGLKVLGVVSTAVVTGIGLYFAVYAAIIGAGSPIVR